MPFTPFHFGLGYAAASLERKPRFFCFFLFVATQVVIDVETLMNMLSGAPRLHTFFHTFIGSLVAAALTSAIFYVCFPVGAKIVSILNSNSKRGLDRWRLFPVERPSFLCIMISSVFGGWTHVVLDSIMHSDILPLAPFSRANPIYELITMDQLYLLCLGFLLVGLVVLSFVHNRRLAP